MPTPASAKIPVSGDINVTPGVYTRHIVERPELTKGKFVDITPEVLTFGDMLKIYGEVTGRQTGYFYVSPEAFADVWGVAGKEVADQFVFGEQFKNGFTTPGSITKEQLGIKDDEWPGFRQTLESLKDQF